MTDEQLDLWKREPRKIELEAWRLYEVRSLAKEESDEPDKMYGVLSEESGQLMLFPGWRLHRLGDDAHYVLVPGS